MPQGTVTKSLAAGFSGSVLGRLEASRTFQPFGMGSAMAMSYAMPTKAQGLVLSPPPDKRWSIYSDVSYGSGSRNREFVASDYDYTSVGGSVGVEYRRDRNWRLGGMFSYSAPDVKLGVQNARNHIDAYQFAAYGSLHRGELVRRRAHGLWPPGLHARPPAA